MKRASAGKVRDRHHGHAHGPGDAPRSLIVYSPAGVVAEPVRLRRALARLRELGFDASLDASATARHRRFAGDDDVRLAALHRTADARPQVALAARGGYGLTRLLDRLEWKRLARAVEAGTRWVGHSDLTVLQLGLLAHTGATSWAGPLAADDFGRGDVEGGGDDVTQATFVEAMHGDLEAIGFRTSAATPDGLDAKGVLWGGNLSMLCSLLGTPHWPQVDKGILFLEDVNEHPYRVERCLLQLVQAGVIGRQKAVVLGDFTGWKPSPLDRGYTLATAIARVRAATRTPFVDGLPFGHVPVKVCLPVGRRARLLVDGRSAWLGW